MPDKPILPQPHWITSAVSRLALGGCFRVLLVLPLFGCGVKGPLILSQSELTAPSLQQLTASCSVTNPS